MEEEELKEAELEGDDEPIEESDLLGEDEGEPEDVTEERPEAKKEQDKEERARQAQARREREAKERAEREKRIRDEAYLKGKLDGTKVNSFTNEPIEDEYDLKVYEIQKELDAEGKDPLADLPRRLAEMDRKSASKAKEENEAKKQQEESVANDLADFRKKHPDVDPKALLADEDFKDYSEGRLGVKGGKSMAEIYEGFQKLKAKFGKPEAEPTAKVATPPSPKGGRKSERTAYSDMSEADKIKELKRKGFIN